MDIINIIFALASIGLGIFGWLAPQYTLDTLDLQAGPSGMGPSEIRASAGALFVGMGWARWCWAGLWPMPCWAFAGWGRLWGGRPRWRLMAGRARNGPSSGSRLWWVWARWR